MRVLLLAAALVLSAFPAFAQASGIPPMFDLTGVAISMVSGVFSVVGVVLPLWLARHMKDQAAAVVLGNAVRNSLGAVQQVAIEGIKTLSPSVSALGLPPGRAAGVQYVLNHAGDEAARFGITPAAIADKIDAQIGLANIATNIAAAIPDPLGPLTTKTGARK